MSIKDLPDNLLNPASYKILSSLKENPEYTTYECVSKGDEKKYVLKRFNFPEFGKTEQKKFVREVCAYTLIKHPVAVKMHGYFLTPENQDILFESVKGETLDKKLNSLFSRITSTQKMKIIVGIVSVVAHLHANGLTHRDINPTNVLLLNETLEPKLINYANARSYDKVASVTALSCPTCYNAPESIENTPSQPSMDIFSIGSLIYRILTGKEADKDIKFKKFYSGKRPKLNSDIPTAFQNLILSAWNPDPSKRPTAQQILTEILRNEKSFTEGTNGKSVFNRYNWEEYVKYYKEVYDATDPFIDQESRQLKVKCQYGDFISWYNYAKHILEKYPKDKMVKKEAIKFLEKSAEYDFYLACYELAMIYIKKGEEDKKKRAIKLFEKGAEQLHSDSMFELGKCYYRGKGVKKDFEKAIKLFQKASQNGHMDATAFYAQMLFKGEGVEMNKDKGREILNALVTLDKFNDKYNDILDAMEKEDGEE